MNVQELREALADLPAHWPVHVAVKADGSGGGADTDYLYTLDVQRDNFPTQGCMAVIRIDYGGPTTSEEATAFLRAARKYPERPTPGVKGTRRLVSDGNGGFAIVTDGVKGLGDAQR